MSQSTYGTYASVSSFTANMEPGQNGLVTVVVQIKNFHSQPAHNFHKDYLPPIAADALKDWLKSDDENAQLVIFKKLLQETRAALDRMCNHQMIEKDSNDETKCLACGLKMT